MEDGVPTASWKLLCVCPSKFLTSPCSHRDGNIMPRYPGPRRGSLRLRQLQISLYVTSRHVPSGALSGVQPPPPCTNTFPPLSPSRSGSYFRLRQAHCSYSRAVSHSAPFSSVPKIKYRNCKWTLPSEGLALQQPGDGGPFMESRPSFSTLARERPACTPELTTARRHCICQYLVPGQCPLSLSIQ